MPEMLKIGELPHDVDDMPLDTSNLPDQYPEDGELFQPTVQSMEQLSPQAPELTPGRLAGRLYHTAKSTPALIAKSRRISLEADDPSGWSERPYVAPTPFHAMQIHQQMMDAANRGETWRPDKTKLDSAYEQMGPRRRNAIDAETLRLMDDGHDEESARRQATISAIEAEQDEKIGNLLAVESADAWRMPDEYDQSSGFLEDIAGGLGTTIASLFAFAVSPYLGAMQVWETLRGAKVQELEHRSQFQPGGIDAQAIEQSATVSATLQTPLEALSNLFILSRILKPRGTWGQTIVAIGESMLGEGATEFVQQYPDEFATMLALNPDAPKGELARTFVANLPETTGEAAYAGLVGAFSGGMTTGAGIGAVETATATANAVGRLLTPTQKRVNDERLNRAQAVMDKVVTGTANADDIAELRAMAGLPEETAAEGVVAEVNRRIVLQAPVVSPMREQARQALEQRYAGSQYVDLTMTLMDQMARRWADGKIQQGEEVTPADFYEQVVRFETEQGGENGPVLEQAGNALREGFHPATDEERTLHKVPPGWESVQIADDPNAKRIAVGLDSKGRWQSIYSVEHSTAALAEKFMRLRSLFESEDDIYNRIQADAANGNEEAAVLRLIFATGFRVGSDRDTKAEKKAYGATTLSKENVEINGDTVYFSFVGKAGKEQKHSLSDAEIAGDISRRIGSGKDRLFDTTDRKVRAYLKSIAPGFKVHDFRTRVATTSALEAIERLPKPTDAATFFGFRDAVADFVAEKIGDTRDVALGSYIAPEVFTAWEDSANVTPDTKRPAGKATTAARQSAETTLAGVSTGEDGSVLRDARPEGRDAPQQRAINQPDTTPTTPPRGAIRNLFSDGPKIIQLFQGADVTTPIHEITHLWTRLLFDEGAEDYFTLARWAGVDDARAEKGIDAWTVEELEKVARAGEAYIMEGRAPTPGMQPIFSRLKEWFLEIYKSIKALGVELTPEVRDVFDRLVSLDFQRQDDALADVTDWLNADAVDEAKPLDPATTTWSDIEAEAKRRVLERAMDERKKADRDARKALMDEARRVVEEYPAYKMLSELRTVGLDIEKMKGELAPETLAALQKRIPAMVKAGGMDPIMFAASFGYRDVKSLAEDILATPAKKQAVQEHFDSLWDEYQRGLQEENAAIYGAILDEEAKILEELTGAAAKGGESTKTVIREMTGQVSDPEYRKLVEDFKANQRVAKQAFAAGKKEAAAAALAQQRERIRAIYQARRDQKERQQIDRRMREYISGKRRGKRVPHHYAEQIRNLLSAYYQLPASPAPEVGLDQFLAAKAGAEPYAVANIQALLRTIPQQQFATDKNGAQRRVPLTLDEKRHVAAVADAIAMMGRIENAIIEEGHEIDFAETVSKIVGSGYDSHNKQPPPDVAGPIQRRKETMRDRLLKVPNGIAAELRKIEFLVSELDGWENRGEAWMRIFRPIAKGEQLRDELAERISKQLARIFAGRDAKWARTPVRLSDGTELNGGKGQAFMIALNGGNAGNYAALTDQRGNRFNDGQVLEIVTRVLDDSERQMVKDLWELADSLYPFLNDVHKTLTGAPLPKVGGDPEAGSAVEQVLAALGETEQRYFPMVFDPKLSARAGYFDSERAARDLFTGPYGAASVEAGHRVARKGGRLPLLLDLSAITRHFGTVIHDIAFQVPIRNAQKIFAHPAFRQMIGDVLSEQHYEVLTPWLQNIARPGLAITGGTFEKIALRIKRNTSVVALGVNLVTTALQGSAYTQTIAELGERAALGGLVKFASSPRKWFEFVRQNSIMMRNRQKSWDRELSDMHNMFDAEVLGRHGDRLRDGLFWVIGATDTLTAAASWVAAYDVAIRKSGMALDHEAAVEYADRIVRQTQGTGAPKDLASVQHLSLMLRFVTMFYTFFSTFYNRLADTSKQYRLGKINELQVFRSVFWNWIVPASLPSMLGYAMASAFGEDDPEEKLLGEWAQDVILYLTGAAPIFRDIAGAAISDYQVTLSPVEGSLRAVRQLTQQFERVARGEDTSGGKGLLKAAITTTGYATGVVPSVQVNRAVDGIWELMEGETDNPMRLFYRPYTSYK